MGEWGVGMRGVGSGHEGRQGCLQHRIKSCPNLLCCAGNYYSNKRWCCGEGMLPAGCTLSHSVQCRAAPAVCGTQCPQAAASLDPALPTSFAVAGDMDHFDISVWAFEKLADLKWGVIAL